MAKILSKKKNDISFIDPETGKVLCTFNQCRAKFVEASDEVVKTPNWSPTPIVHTAHYHQCKECGRQVRGRGDSRKSVSSYYDGVHESLSRAKSVR